MPLSPCPYVVSFYDAFVDSGEGTLNFVMEYMDGGSLEVRMALVTFRMMTIEVVVVATFFWCRVVHAFT